MFKDYDYFGAFMMVIGAAAFAALGWGSITGKLPKKPRGDYDWILDSLGGSGLPVSGFGGWIILILSGMLRRCQLIGCLAGSEPEAGAQKGN